MAASVRHFYPQLSATFHQCPPVWLHDWLHDRVPESRLVGATSLRWQVPWCRITPGGNSSSPCRCLDDKGRRGDARVKVRRSRSRWLELGQRLGEFRARYGITLPEIAAAVSAGNDSAVAQWESDVNVPKGSGGSAWWNSWMGGSGRSCGRPSSPATACLGPWTEVRAGIAGRRGVTAARDGRQPGGSNPGGPADGTRNRDVTPAIWCARRQPGVVYG